MSIFPAILNRAWRVDLAPGRQPRVVLAQVTAYGEIVATVAGFTGDRDTHAVTNAIAAVPDLIAFAMRVMMDHRGGRCGCSQCDEARRILKTMVVLPNEAEGETK